IGTCVADATATGGEEGTAKVREATEAIGRLLQS
ncbi:MAG: transcriptional regulator, partial [Actinomycetota bacterium]|nr:transcriptional regulator [Actinomycetota bacterium]